VNSIADQQWKDEATRQLSEAKAEIARLQKENDEWRRDYDRGTKMSDLSAEVRSEINHWKGRAEKAEAEIARLRKAFKEYVRVTTPLLGDSKALAAAIAALKPDTGETP